MTRRDYQPGEGPARGILVALVVGAVIFGVLIAAFVLAG